MAYEYLCQLFQSRRSVSQEVEAVATANDIHRHQDAPHHRVRNISKTFKKTTDLKSPASTKLTDDYAIRLELLQYYTGYGERLLNHPNTHLQNLSYTQRWLNSTTSTTNKPTIVIARSSPSSSSGDAPPTAMGTLRQVMSGLESSNGARMQGVESVEAPGFLHKLSLHAPLLASTTREFSSERLGSPESRPQGNRSLLHRQKNPPNILFSSGLEISTQTPARSTKVSPPIPIQRKPESHRPNQPQKEVLIPTSGEPIPLPGEAASRPQATTSCPRTNPERAYSTTNTSLTESATPYSGTGQETSKLTDGKPIPARFQPLPLLIFATNGPFSARVTSLGSQGSGLSASSEVSYGCAGLSMNSMQDAPPQAAFYSEKRSRAFGRLRMLTEKYQELLKKSFD
ncbi:MAG: hypothetical protein Q9168_001406 [Polycauliona sp. 1 TL-2023]